MHACAQDLAEDDRSPYFCLLMANDTVVQQPFKPQSMTQELTRHAIDFLQWAADANGRGASAGDDAGDTGEQPFFFMYSFLHVHTPLFSSPAFANVSAGGRFGDNVEEMDDAVGQVLAALDLHGFSNETLILLTSDVSFAFCLAPPVRICPPACLRFSHMPRYWL